MSKPTLRERIVEILERNAWSGYGFSSSSLAVRLRASQTQVSIVLRKLVQANLVSRDGHGKSTKYAWIKPAAPHRGGKESP